MFTKVVAATMAGVLATLLVDEGLKQAFAFAPAWAPVLKNIACAAGGFVSAAWLTTE